MRYSYLESINRKQQDKSKMFEAKQVGDLYHVCSLRALSKYIAPTDTLQGSGKYNNWLLGGDTDIVSFTRDVRFILHTWRDEEFPVVFQFKVDGNKLSENHKITPYNDFHYDISNGLPIEEEQDEIPYREKEEVVRGKIHPFSKYIKEVYFDVGDNFPDLKRKDNWKRLFDNLMDAYHYIEDFPITQNRNIFSKYIDGFRFDAFEDLLEFVHTILMMLDGKRPKSEILKRTLLAIPVNERSKWGKMAIDAKVGDMIFAFYKYNLFSIKNKYELAKRELRKAIEEGDVEKVKRVVDSGIDVNSSFKLLGSPLNYAIIMKQPRVVEALLERGADPNLKDDMNKVPILLCTSPTEYDYNKSKEIVQILDALLRNKADVDVRDISSGITPLMNSIYIGNSELTKKLIDCGADVNIGVVNNIWSPLTKAVHNGDIDIVKMLLDSGADVNFVDASGGTPLLLAVESGNTELVETLLEADADVNQLIKKKKKTVLDVAEYLQDNEDPIKYGEIVDLLISYGAENGSDID